MPKILLSLMAIAFAITLGTTPAWGQAEITLFTSNYEVAFTGTGSGDSTLRIGGTGSQALCSGSTNCKATFTDGATSISGFYSLSPVTGITVTETSATTFDLSTAPITFCFSSAAGCKGTIYLEGTLTLTSLSQAGKTGTFDYSGGADLTGIVNPPSTLGADFPLGQGETQISLNFSINQNLSTIGLGKTLTSRINSGTVDPVPEPASMLLFGSGLLAAGVALRRRLASPA